VAHVSTDPPADPHPNPELSRVSSPNRGTAVRSLRRLLETSDLPSGLTITEHPSSGRNRVFVVAGDGRRWIAKAGASGRESWFYREVGPNLSWVPASSPVSDRAVTVTAYLEQAVSVEDLARDSPSQALSVLVSTAPLLAELHAWSPPSASAPAPAANPAIPELAPVHVSEWLDGTEGSFHLLQSIQRREMLCRALREATAGVGPQGLIHGDIKADNILRGPDGPLLIDWELCGQGRVGWDVGCVVGSMLAVWIEGVDFRGTAPATWLQDTVVPYQEICDAVGQFVDDYRTRIAHEVPSMSVVTTYAATWLATRTWAESLSIHWVKPTHLLRLVVAEGLLRNPTAIFGRRTW